MQTVGETAVTAKKSGRVLLKYIAFALGIVLLLMGQALFSVIHWLNLAPDSLHALAWLNPLPKLQYPDYFWTVLLLLIIALVLLLVGQPENLLMAVGDVVLSPPPVLRLPPRGRVVWLVLLIFSLLVTSIAGWRAVADQGNLPPLLWLAMLIVVGLTCWQTDRLATQSRVNWQVLAACVGYVVWLLALGYLFRALPSNDLLGRGSVIIVAGLISAILWRWRPGGLPRVAIAFGLVSLIGLAFYTYAIYAGRFAFIGDEYAFYKLAYHLLDHSTPANLLSYDGVYNLNPVFASYTHSFTMALYGPDLYGWRISESFMVLLAAPALYMWVRSFAAQRVAWLSLLIFLAAHHLLALSKIGYNNLQALPPFVLALALLVWAARRHSWLGLYMGGIAAAFTFYTYGITIPFVLLMGGLLLLNFRGGQEQLIKAESEPENIASPTPVVQIVQKSTPLNPVQRALNFGLNIVADWPAVLIWGLGFVLAALPRLANYTWLTPLATKTVAQSEVKIISNPLTEQILPNFLYTLTATLHFNDNSHYISGAHLDPLSSLLGVVGVGWCMSQFRKRRIAVWLLVSLVLGSFFVGGLASYPYPVNTRTFILLPFYAVLAAIGCEFWITVLGRLKFGRQAIWAFIAVLIVAIISLNLYQFLVLAPRDDSQTDIAALVEQYQKQPANTTFYVVSQNISGDDLPIILRAYGDDPNHVLLFGGQGAASVAAQIKRSARWPYQILVATALPGRDQWLVALHDNWPDVPLTELDDPAKTGHFTLLSPPATTVSPVPATVSPVTAHPQIVVGVLPTLLSSWSLGQPRDIALGPDKLLYIINGDKKTIEVYNQQGQLQRSLTGGWKEPYSLAFNSKGQIIVLDAAQSPYLTRISTDGKVLAQFDGNVPGDAIYSPRTVAVDTDDDIYVADTGRSRILRFSPDFVYLTSITGGGILKQPASVGIVGDKLIVADENTLFVMSKSGDVSSKWTIPAYLTPQPPRFLPNQTQTIATLSPNDGSLVLYDLQGQMLQTMGPPTIPRLQKPVGLAYADGKIFVIENEGNAVKVYNWNN